MNSTITFPPARPVLKLTRTGVTTAPFAPSDEKWAATLSEERHRLLEDQEALRVREENLRDYETRLRALQAEIEAGRGGQPVAPRATNTPFLRPSSKSPFADDSALQAAWEKLHRARGIFEAEQASLRDDRIVLHDQQAEVKQREEAVAAREARVAECEQRIIAANPPAGSGEPIAGEHTMSAMTRLTRAPFGMARAVFGGGK